MWIYGLNPVLEALRARRNIKEVYVSSGRHEKLFLIKKETESRGIALRIVDVAFLMRDFPRGIKGLQ